jgi:hypothetical protein
MMLKQMLARNLAAGMALGLAALGLPACSSAPAGSVQAGSAPNTLKREEARDGFKLLFNGKDLTGWRVYKAGPPPAQWTVVDGAMHLVARGGGDLVTEQEYGPFDLRLEWKIAPGGNSGVMYLVKELDRARNTYNTGPEMQVLDDAAHPDGRIPSHRAGALYDFAEPFAAAAKPVGEWNEARVLYTGDRIEHWLNGVKVAETSYGDAQWLAKVANTKFKTMPDFGLASTGRIALQDHGDQVWYRSVRIRTLN